MDRIEAGSYIVDNKVNVLGEPMLQNITLHPASKSVFEGGSASAFAEVFSRSVWENNALKQVEELTCVNDAEQYGEYEVSAPYTIKVVKRPDHRYFNTLREKMMWGADTR